MGRECTPGWKSATPHCGALGMWSGCREVLAAAATPPLKVSPPRGAAPGKRSLDEMGRTGLQGSASTQGALPLIAGHIDTGREHMIQSASHPVAPTGR